MPTVRQTNFSAGELSPLLWGRTDLEAHSSGVRRALNWFITREGSLRSRGGTMYAGTLQSPVVRLVPFVVSDSKSFVVAFHLPYSGVGTLVDAWDTSTSPATQVPVTVPTSVGMALPLTQQALDELQVAQAGFVLTLTHPDSAPLELVYNPASGSLALQRARFTTPVDDPLVGGAPIAPWFKSSSGNRGIPYLVNSGINRLFYTDTDHPPREWRWKVATLMRHRTTGEVSETYADSVRWYFDGTTQASAVTLPLEHLVVLYPDQPVVIRFPSWATPQPEPANWEFLGLAWYRGKGKLYGLVGFTDYAQDFVDTGAEPDYTVQPRVLLSEPFASNESPAAVAFFQRRRFFAATRQRQQLVIGSATDDWGYYVRASPPVIPDDSPVELSLYGLRREAVRSLVPGPRLLALTDAGVWTLGGTEQALTPASLETRREDDVGSEAVQPATMDGYVCYARAKGRGVRALAWQQGGAIQGADISWHAQHLFLGGEGTFSGGGTRTIKAMAYQEDPWSLLWVLRQDGRLVCAQRSGSWFGWTQVQLPQARVASMCVVPVAGEDAVFLAVQRGSKTLLERLSNRVEAGNADDWACLDSAIRVESAVGLSGVIGGLSHLAGQQVYVAARRNPPRGPFQVTSGGTVDIGAAELVPNYQGSGDQDETSTVAFIGVKYDCDLELLDLAPSGVRFKQKTVREVAFEVDNAQGLEVGSSLSLLTPWRQRQVSDGYGQPGLETALVVVPVKDNWNRYGRAALRLAWPSPATVLGIAREVEVGDGN